MKVKIGFEWDRMAQKELGVELDIPEHIAQALIISHFMNWFIMYPRFYPIFC